ncbi:MAG TPA: hypothetical protein VF614_18350, partial [Chthoniobacteraceae bacterium]
MTPPDINDDSSQSNEQPRPPALALTERPCTGAIAAAICRGLPEGLDTVITLHVPKTAAEKLEDWTL